jgi:plastocyanin
VDTIPAGRTMEWSLEFDYDQHGVASVGTPAFQGGDFPYNGRPTVSVRFDTPGTYHYTDPYHPSATGILVVH